MPRHQISKNVIIIARRKLLLLLLLKLFRYHFDSIPQKIYNTINSINIHSPSNIIEFGYRNNKKKDIKHMF